MSLYTEKKRSLLYFQLVSSVVFCQDLESYVIAAKGYLTLVTYSLKINVTILPYV